MTEPDLAVPVTGKGRHYKHPITGELYPSVTNIIDVLDKPALVRWAAREVAGAAFDQRKALINMRDRDAAIDMLRSAPYRNRDKKAKVGDIVHSIAEALVAGTKLPSFGDEEAPYVEAFMDFVSEFDPTFTVVEATVFNDTHHYAGTFDTLMQIEGFNVLGDYKTGKGIYAEVALQLAALRNGEFLWNKQTGELSEMPKIDACVAVHLRPREFKVHIVPAGEDAFEAFVGCLGSWPWAGAKGSDGAIGPAMNRTRLLAEIQKPQQPTLEVVS